MSPVIYKQLVKNITNMCTGNTFEAEKEARENPESMY